MSITTIGADIEFFLVDEQGVMVSAEGLIGGTKESPRPCIDGALQEDGLLCEINIDPVELLPENADEWVRRIRSVMQQAHELTGYRLVAQPTMTVPEELQDSRAFRELGCDRDRNLYEGGFNPVPNGQVDFRTTGGHIHIGHEDQSPENLTRFIIAIDQLAYQTTTWEESRRRILYGSYGSFRLKPYGVEVRTLSSTWTNSVGQMKQVFNLMCEVNEGKEMIQFKRGMQVTEVLTC